MERLSERRGRTLLARFSPTKARKQKKQKKNEGDLVSHSICKKGAPFCLLRFGPLTRCEMLSPPSPPRLLLRSRTDEPTIDFVMLGGWSCEDFFIWRTYLHCKKIVKRFFALMELTTKSITCLDALEQIVS